MIIFYAQEHKYSQRFENQLRSFLTDEMLYVVTDKADLERILLIPSWQLTVLIFWAMDHDELRFLTQLNDYTKDIKKIIILNDIEPETIRLCFKSYPIYTATKPVDYTLIKALLLNMLGKFKDYRAKL